MEARERIIRKAIQLYLSRWIRSVTMDDVAVESGVSKRTIYEIFKDKDDLVLQSLSEMIMQNNRAALEIIDKTNNVIEAIFYILKGEQERQANLAPVFINDIKKYFPMLNETLYSKKESIKKFSPSYMLLEKGVKEEIFNRAIRIDLVDNFLHELIGLMHNSERLALLQPTAIDVLNNIFLPYFKGLCTRRGLELMEKYSEEIEL